MSYKTWWKKFIEAINGRADSDDFRKACDAANERKEFEWLRKMYREGHINVSNKTGRAQYDRMRRLGKKFRLSYKKKK